MILVAKRYASLYFVISIDREENELLTLDVMHFYVEPTGQVLQERVRTGHNI